MKFKAKLRCFIALLVSSIFVGIPAYADFSSLEVPAVFSCSGDDCPEHIRAMEPAHPGIALPNDLKLQSADDRVAGDDCFLDSIFTSGGLFNNRNDAERLCGDLGRITGLGGFCAVRAFSDRLYSGQFRYRRVFTGRDRSNIFRQYSDFINNRRFNDGRFVSAFQWGGVCR